MAPPHGTHSTHKQPSGSTQTHTPRGLHHRPEHGYALQHGEYSSQQTSWGSNARTRLHQAAGVSCGMLGGCSAAVWTPCNGCSEREWEFFPFRSALARMFLGTSRCAGGDGDGARSSGLARSNASPSAHRHMRQARAHFLPSMVLRIPVPGARTGTKVDETSRRPPSPSLFGL